MLDSYEGFTREFGQLEADKYFENNCFLLRDYSKRKHNQRRIKSPYWWINVRKLFAFINPILK